MRRSSIAAFARERRVALTTVAARDRVHCDRLQNSLVRGPHELLYWGVGPELRRGDIVALYTPKSKYLPESEHGRVRRIYFAAAASTPGSTWNQHVFLHRRVELQRPLTFRELRRVGLPFWNIVRPGKLTEPMAPDVAIKFLSAVSQRTGGLTRLRELARGTKRRPRLCISYSGHDWTQAHRLKLWLDTAGLRPFFISPVADVLPDEEGPLEDLLNDTFSSASVVVCLVPPRAKFSKWVRLEVRAAVAHAKRTILVRTDAKRPWPSLPSKRSVRRHTLRPTRERDLASRVRRELAAIDASSS